MPSLNLLPSNTQSDGAWASAVPSSIKTTAKIAADAAQPSKGAPAMGQKDFLTLFTTQLKNQDPLKPDDAAQMAAQLAQFNGLEQMMNVNKNLEQMTSNDRKTKNQNSNFKTKLFHPNLHLNSIQRNSLYPDNLDMPPRLGIKCQRQGFTQLTCCPIHWYGLVAGKLSSLGCQLRVANTYIAI